jgi:hypothetical protein
MFNDNWETLLEGQDDGVATVLNEHPDVRILFERRHKLPSQLEINNINPIMHVLLEGTVENQLRDPDMPEVKAAIERLEGKGLSRHAARGCVTRIFIKYFYDVLSAKKRFDENRYRHQVSLLGTDFDRVGRNSPCPCDSGLKFKHCCMDMADDFKTSKLAGALCLGQGMYIFGPLESFVEDPLEPILQLENRGHIADYLEEHGDIQGARQCLEESVALAEGYKGGELLMNALQDLELLCINHRLRDGIKVAERLMALTENDDERGNYWCDKADLLARIGRTEEAEQEFRSLLDTLSLWHNGRYRYALFLEENGKKEDALAVLRQLVVDKKEIDAVTYQHAREVLRDWEGS